MIPATRAVAPRKDALRSSQGNSSSDVKALPMPNGWQRPNASHPAAVLSRYAGASVVSAACGSDHHRRSWKKPSHRMGLSASNRQPTRVKCAPSASRTTHSKDCSRRGRKCRGARDAGVAQIKGSPSCVTILRKARPASSAPRGPSNKQTVQHGSLPAGRTSRPPTWARARRWRTPAWRQRPGGRGGGR